MSALNQLRLHPKWVRWMAIAGFVVGLLGLVPLFVLLAEISRNRLPQRRMLRLASKWGVEILVTTSSTGISNVGPAAGPRARRDLLPSGDMAGVAELYATIRAAYPKKVVEITPSSLQQRDGRRDIVVIGGPVHNRFAAQYISEDPSDKLSPIVFDANTRYIRVGTKVWGPNLDLHFVDHVPTREYAVVLLTGVGRFGRQARMIAVGGLTTYGTHAGAHFIAYSLPTLKPIVDHRKSFVGLVRASLVNGQPTDVRLEHFEVVDEIEPIL